MTASPKSEDAGQALEMAAARAALCGLLSRLFAEKPTSELLESIKAKEMLDALAGFEVVFDADFIAGEEKQQAEELAVEYTRLFFGPGPHVVPYESVYIMHEGEDAPRLWGQATVEVADFYRDAGLGLESGQVPDHISLEFQAMAALAREEIGKRESGDLEGAERLLSLQERFCREHLLRWVPKLCKVVESVTKSSFYRNVAALTENYILWQCSE